MSIRINIPTFLDLPYEIRLKLYSDLFLRSALNLYRKPNSLNLCMSDCNPPFDLQKIPVHHTAISTAFLLTCKQISEEGALVLYSRNTFGFHDPRVLLEFLVCIGQSNTRNIRAIHITVPWNQEKWIFWPSELVNKLSCETKNLETINVTFEAIPKNQFKTYGFVSQEDMLGWVAGHRISVEFNLRLVFGMLSSRKKMAVGSDDGDYWVRFIETGSDVHSVPESIGNSSKLNSS
ncbi:hypothetical protein F5884DRAFT_876560 [Xylogone sp. PMI_703]|nr:hypothetical protein F5884DRAFT_876560 [Xylogone sp. PMI_703]